MSFRAEIDALFQEGNELQDADDLPGALEKFRAALKLLPEKYQHEQVAGWIQVAVADVLFYQREFAEARRHIEIALFETEGCVGNPFIHLRRGQILLELGDLDEADSELRTALRLGGTKVFENEDQKYFDFVNARTT